MTENTGIYPILKAVDAVEEDTFSVVIAQDIEGVAVEDANSLANTGAPDDAGSVPYCGGVEGA